MNVLPVSVDGRETNSTSSARAARAATRAWVAAAASRLGVTEATVRRWIRSGRLNPTCRDVYANVFPYLDRELTVEDHAMVERHIAACPGLRGAFRVRRHGPALRAPARPTPADQVGATGAAAGTLQGPIRPVVVGTAVMFAHTSAAESLPGKIATDTVIQNVLPRPLSGSR